MTLSKAFSKPANVNPDWRSTIRRGKNGIHPPFPVFHGGSALARLYSLTSARREYLHLREHRVKYFSHFFSFGKKMVAYAGQSSPPPVLLYKEGVNGGGTFP
jgi:hypothetical protein